MADIYELIKRAQSGDIDATQEIVETNSRLVWSIVRKFIGRGCEPDDLFQIGSIGLLKCIEKFDLSYDVKFSTYAVPMIMGEIKRFLRDDGIIKVSRSLKEIAVKAMYMTDTLTKKNGAAPTVNELAENLDVDVTDLLMALEANNEVESIYQTVYQNDGNPVFLLDKLEQKGSEEDIVDNITLKQAIGTLSGKERQIIMMRYFDDKTQSEVADMIGISQVQVSRIEKKILKRIRDNIG